MHSRVPGLIFVAVSMALIALAAAAWRLHDSRSVQLFGGLITAVPASDSVIALTFDDGPATYTDSILDLLRRYDAKATFFVTGAALERNAALGRRIVEEGHELGNHSYSHRRLVLRTPATIRHEVETADSLIRVAGHTGPIHFRPPYGKRLVGLPWYLARTARKTVLWTLEPDSWYRSAERMAEHVVENVRSGSIILLHVELQSRVEERRALSLILKALHERGYRFVTVSQLLDGSSTPAVIPDPAGAMVATLDTIHGLFERHPRFVFRDRALAIDERGAVGLSDSNHERAVLEAVGVLDYVDVCVGDRCRPPDTEPFTEQLLICSVPRSAGSGYEIHCVLLWAAGSDEVLESEVRVRVVKPGSAWRVASMISYAER